MPNTMNAEDSAPRIRYFTPASSDTSRLRWKLVEDIKCDGDEFDGNEQHREIIGRRGEQHSRQRKDDERIIFRDARGDAVGKFRGHEQHQNGGDEEEAFEKQGQRVFDEHAVEGRAGQAANAVAAQADQQQHAQRGDGGVAEKPLALGGHKQIRQHQHEAEGDHADFERDQGSVHQFRIADCGLRSSAKALAIRAAVWPRLAAGADRPQSFARRA